MARNRLKNEKSPYLLQHADNPVDWFPWGGEAFEKAKKEDKPIFLSLGYATCHWCHVMAHESFEDPEVAELMNEAFVNIKVDREERPDIDNTYMRVCQMMTGSGGWPLTIFMTPEKKPFYAATYIPKRGRSGRPGMLELIPWIRGIWEEEREKIESSTREIIGAFRKSADPGGGSGISDTLPEKAYREFSRQFDERHGGFGSSPKFPSPHNLMFLLRYWKRTGDQQALEMVEKTLQSIRLGGVFDHVGYGFHRYSTDREWLLPHFEKMLYDQAMLMMAYTETWQATGGSLYKKTVEEIAEYVIRDLGDPDGAFYSAEDADSEGEEGKFYVWTTDEIRTILDGEEAELFIELYNLKEEGNYREEATGRKSGKNIPHLREPIGTLAGKIDMTSGELETKIEAIRSQLFEAREKRVRPLLDDKILTDWNGLMIGALAKAGIVTGSAPYIERAEKACGFILSHLQKKDGTLLHRYRDNEAAITGLADDYAFLTWGLLELYEATYDSRYLEHALDLNDTFIDHFWDDENGGFWFTGSEGEELLGRTKEGYDGAIPSGNSVAMMNLLRLGRFTAEPRLEEYADRIGRLFSEQMLQAPTGFGQMMQAVEFVIGSSAEIVIAGGVRSEDTHAMLKELIDQFIPHKVVLVNDPEDDRIEKLAPFTKQQKMKDGKATAYICRNYSCEHPVTDPDQMAELLASL